MNTSKTTPLKCTMQFGLSEYHHPVLMQQFYPEDIPEDWLLDYYSNEFQVVLIDPEDMLREHSAISSISGDDFDRMLQAFEEQLEDVSEAGFQIILNVDALSSERVETIKIKLLEHYTYFDLINIKEMTSIGTEHFPTLKWGCCQNQNDQFVYLISEETKLEAVQLRQLIELIQSHALDKQANEITVFFSVNPFSLENCRNAILLENMM